MSAQFVAEEGPLAGLSLALEGAEEWVLGRDPDQVDVVVEDPSASEKQVLCRKTPKGITIENLSDTSSIRVNDEVVEEPQLLRNDDTVQIGETLFRFSYSMDVAESEATEEAEAAAEGEEEAEAEDMQMQQDTILEESEFGEDSLAEVHFDVGRQGRWVLKVIAGPNTGAELPMEAGQNYTIGTDTSACDVVFQDVSVSRQHAQVKITDDYRVLIHDMESRNGVLIDGEPIEHEEELGGNNVVTVGTTAFVVSDTEAEAATIVSPLIPKAPGQEKEEDQGPTEEEIQKQKEEEVKKAQEKTSLRTGLGLILFALLLFGTIGYGITTLFTHEEVVEEAAQDVGSSISELENRYPGITFSYNRSTGTLLALGHVLTKLDYDRLVDEISDLRFVRSLNDRVTIDELVWQNTNQILAKNEQWQGVTLHSKDKIPGRFVISGQLKTQEQLDSLTTHLNRNFPYVDKLERNIIVEELIVTQVDSILRDNGFNDITVELSNGEVSLTGTMSYELSDRLERMFAEIKELNGVKNLKNFIVELEPEQAMVNLTGQYEVTGYSMSGGTSLNVVINGRILSRGDSLDGMTITSIRPNAIFLERDGFKFRIDYTP